TRDQADRVVDQIASNKAKFLEDILMHELHVHRAKLANPLKMGGVIGLSFLVGALIPLAPFLFLQTRIESLIGAALVAPTYLLSVGAWRGHVGERKLWRPGRETLLIYVS